MNIRTLITATAVGVAILTTTRYRQLIRRNLALEEEVDDGFAREMELLALLEQITGPPGYSAVELEGWLWSWQRWRVKVAHVLAAHQSDTSPPPPGFPRPLP